MEILYTSGVNKFLESLDKIPRGKILQVISLLREFGNKIGMPHSKHIDINLYELRARGGQEIRIFYTFHSNQAILLHGFIKKSQKTPANELRQAQKLKHLVDT